MDITHQKNPCQKIERYENGQPVYRNKKVYYTDKDAIEAARIMNTKPYQIHKAVAYKCPKCHKWHIGRNKTILSEKDKEQYKNKNN